MQNCPRCDMKLEIFTDLKKIRFMSEGLMSEEDIIAFEKSKLEKLGISYSEYIDNYWKIDLGEECDNNVHYEEEERGYISASV